MLSALWAEQTQAITVSASDGFSERVAALI